MPVIISHTWELDISINRRWPDLTPRYNLSQIISNLRSRYTIIWICIPQISLISQSIIDLRPRCNLSQIISNLRPRYTIIWILKSQISVISHSIPDRTLRCNLAQIISYPRLWYTIICQSQTYDRDITYLKPEKHIQLSEFLYLKLAWYLHQSHTWNQDIIYLNQFKTWDLRYNLSQISSNPRLRNTIINWLYLLQ